MVPNSCAGRSCPSRRSRRACPVCMTDGVAVSDPISYQRTPLRLADALAWPVWVDADRVRRPQAAVDQAGRREPIVAAVELAVGAPRFPRCRTVIGAAVAETAIVTLPEMVGVAPGLETRRSISVPSDALSTPMK